MAASVKEGKIFVTSSQKYRTPSEILNSGEPARIRVMANQLREQRVDDEIAPALVEAVKAKDFATIDKAVKNFAGISAMAKRVDSLLADAAKHADTFRPKVAEKTAAA